MKRYTRLLCPVCRGCFWNLYGVSLDRHPRNFLKSKMHGITGPWGTCTRCGNHFSLSMKVPRLLDGPGGLEVAATALIEAKREYFR